jgi:hypothetical protein
MCGSPQSQIAPRRRSFGGTTRFVVTIGGHNMGFRQDVGRSPLAAKPKYGPQVRPSLIPPRNVAGQGVGLMPSVLGITRSIDTAIVDQNDAAAITYP